MTASAACWEGVPYTARLSQQFSFTKIDDQKKLRVKIVSCMNKIEAVFNIKSRLRNLTTEVGFLCCCMKILKDAARMTLNYTREKRRHVENAKAYRGDAGHFALTTCERKRRHVGNAKIRLMGSFKIHSFYLKSNFFPVI